MIYPNQTRENDMLVDALVKTVYRPKPSLYSVAYFTKAGDRELLGVGTIPAKDYEEAERVAMDRLKMACPECKGYTEHKALVIEISEHMMSMFSDNLA